MAESVDGWTAPDWSIYDTTQLVDMLTRHQNAIERHQGNEKAADSMSYWQAMVKSINAELEFRQLATSR